MIKTSQKLFIMFFLNNYIIFKNKYYQNLSNINLGNKINTNIKKSTISNNSSKKIL